ncbi:MAG: hypothetical protein JSV08_01350 [Acidobacteriota bacterium]|nr:MAG: hypothetical protein JSV08_01350 [Acidobacteriota bacterium]
MLDDKQRRYYEELHERTRKEYLSLERQVAEILAGVKERIEGLRGQMDALLKIYAGICDRLDVENDLALTEGEGEEEDEEEEEEEEYDEEEEID